jgi:hypothetical protein
MNSNVSADRQVGNKTKTLFLSILFGLLVGALAVTNQSLWIDEAHSALKAMQPSLGQWWTTMVHDKGSDLQMPFYMFYLWAWAKIFGASEVALRVANVPWFVIGVVTVAASTKRDRFQISWLVVTLSNAFLWYYLSEARPYIVLFAFSSVTTACLFRIVVAAPNAFGADRGPGSPTPATAATFRLFCAGLIGLCATNLVAVPWAIGALAAFVFWIGPRSALKTAARFRWVSLFALGALIALGFYYIWSLRIGARGSDVGRTGFANVVFAFYELCGLAGLGPGRLALREEGIKATVEYAGPVIVGTVAVLALLVPAVAALRKKVTRRDFIFFGIATVLPLLLLMAAAVIGHVRLLGRHLTPLLPFLLVLLAIGFERMFFAERRWLRATAVFSIVVLLISALEIRFAPRHQRDDYRSAANLARAAIGANEKVWWIADESTGAYYNLPLDSPNLTLSSSLTDTTLATIPTPDLVCFSKPDIYDPRGKIDNYLREHDFKMTRALPAFQIFERQPARR